MQYLFSQLLIDFMVQKVLDFLLSKMTLEFSMLQSLAAVIANKLNQILYAEEIIIY